VGEEVSTKERVPHHEPFRKRDTGLRAKLGVAAFDQLWKAV
jgi:hypothetical protein